MSGYPLLQLDDIANVVAGDPAPQDPKAFASDGPPFVRMQDVGRYHRHPSLADSTDHLDTGWVAKNRLRLFPKDSVLIPKSGASVNLNHRAKLATDAYVVSHLAIIIPDRTRIEPDYLYWWSASYDPRAQAQVTSLPSLKLSTLKSALVPLPSLDEQQRIVAILNRAAKIERLRKQAQQRLREFIPALYTKMFGDPADNSMGWETASLGEICAISPRVKKSDTDADDKFVSFVPMNAIDAQEGEITVHEERLLTKVAKGYTSFEDGDILFAKITPCMENGKIALAQNLTNGIGFGSTEFYVLRPSDQVVGEYIYHFVRQNQFREEARKSFTGTAGQQRVPKHFIQNALIPLPPIGMQRRFAKIAESVRTHSKLAMRGSDIGDHLTNSLMSRMLGART